MINIKIRTNNQIITTIFLLFLLTGAFVIRKGPNVTWEMYYLLDAVFIIFIFFSTLLFNRRWVIIKGNNVLCMIPIIMFLIWGYGVIRGFINGNYIEYIIRNNAGILIYILFYVLINADIELINVSRILERISFLIVIITFIGFVIIEFAPSYVINKYLEIPILNCIQIGGVIEKYHPVVHYGRDLIYVSYGCTLWDFLNEKKKINLTIFKLLFISFVIIVIMKSGGTKLALIMNTLFITLSFVGKKMNRKVLLLLFLSFFIGIICIISKKVDFFLSIFSKLDYGNSIRYDQIDYCLKNMTLWGKGFGSDFSDIGRIYMIEISYIDLLYKIGVVAFVVFVIYLITLFKAYTYMYETKNRYAVIPICLMSFLYNALGNNVLFLNNNVFLHVLVLYYLLGIIRIKKEK